MGTSNFHSENESGIFAIEKIDEFIFNDTINNVYNDILSDKQGIDYALDLYELRSYPSKKIASLEFQFEHLEYKFDLTVSAIARCGYYEGFNLDYCVIVEMFNDQVEYREINEDYIYAELRGNEELSAAKCKIQSEHIFKRLQKEKDLLVNKMTTIFKNYSDTYRIVAKFSNGETIYEKI